MSRNSKFVVHRYIDMWAVPGVHPTNLEFMQSFKMADSPHFTRNMDAIGTVSEENEEGDWQKTSLVGIRTDVWKPDSQDVAETLETLREKREQELRKEIKRSGRLSAKQKVQLKKKLEEDQVMQLQCDDIVQRRLVLKLFRTTGTRLNWAGTVEQITTTEIQHSLGSKTTLLSMASILPRHEFIVPIHQNHRTFRIGSIFTLSYFCDDRMWPVCFKQRWPSIGTDYEIFVDGQKIGFINGILFALGSDRYIELYEHPLNKNSKFADLVTLFAASVSFHKSMRRSARKRMAACRSGEWQRCLVEDEELSIYKNGRAD